MDATTEPAVTDRPAVAKSTNNFTPLRLLLAGLVMLTHFNVLSGHRNGFVPFIYPDFAVDGFFIISGALIYASFDRLPELDGFALKRFFRLYPLYIVVVVLQAAIMLALQPDGAGAHLGEAARYLAVNAVFLNFLQNHIGPVLDGSLDPGINPSLWTLKVEVAFYALVPLIWMGVQRWGFRWLVGAFFLSALYTAVFRHIGRFELAKELPGAMQYFILGILLYRYRRAIRVSTPVCWALAAVSAVAITLMQLSAAPMADDHWRILFPLFTAVLVYVLAYRSPYLGMERDISYGVYLIHAPVIQLMFVAGLLSFSVASLSILLCIVIPLALLAEWAIERPCIKLGHVLAARSAKRGPIRLAASNGRT